MGISETSVILFHDRGLANVQKVKYWDIIEHKDKGQY